jgi:hypothetical protein
MPSPTQSELSADSLPASLFDIQAEAPTVRPTDLENDRYRNERSSSAKRALIALVRFLIIFCIGISATLVWQSYGDPAREAIANSYPQLSWMAPQAEPVAQNAPGMIGLAAPIASSPDQQPSAILLDLEAVRQSIDRIATSVASSQEQMTNSADRIATSQDQIARSVDRMATSQDQIARSVDRMATSQDQIARSVDQLSVGQEQMTREVTKLQEIERSIRSRNSEALPRPASASAPKPVSRPASVPAPKPLSRESEEPTVP